MGVEPSFHPNKSFLDICLSLGKSRHVWLKKSYFDLSSLLHFHTCFSWTAWYYRGFFWLYFFHCLSLSPLIMFWTGSRTSVGIIYSLAITGLYN